MSPDPAPATLPPSVLDGLAPMTLFRTRFKPCRNASRNSGSRPQLQTRNWQESMNVSVLPAAAPGAELHLLMFWNPSPDGYRISTDPRGRQPFVMLLSII